MDLADAEFGTLVWWIRLALDPRVIMTAVGWVLSNYVEQKSWYKDLSPKQKRIKFLIFCIGLTIPVVLLALAFGVLEVHPDIRDTINLTIFPTISSMALAFVAGHANHARKLPDTSIPPFRKDAFPSRESIDKKRS